MPNLITSIRKIISCDIMRRRHIRMMETERRRRRKKRRVRERKREGRRKRRRREEIKREGRRRGMEKLDCLLCKDDWEEKEMDIGSYADRI